MWENKCLSNINLRNWCLTFINVCLKWRPNKWKNHEEFHLEAEEYVHSTQIASLTSLLSKSPLTHTLSTHENLFCSVQACKILFEFWFPGHFHCSIILTQLWWYKSLTSVIYDNRQFRPTENIPIQAPEFVRPIWMQGFWLLLNNADPRMEDD